MATPNFSALLPAETLKQLNELTQILGIKRTQVVVTAIHQLYQQEIKAMSNIVIIPQKMSGTGTIHDIANQHFDREINFGDDGKYAIVLASYYGNGDNYYIARTKEEAIELHERHKEFSHQIIDRDGDPISVDWLYNS